MISRKTQLQVNRPPDTLITWLTAFHTSLSFSLVVALKQEQNQSKLHNRKLKTILKERYTGSCNQKSALSLSLLHLLHRNSTLNSESYAHLSNEPIPSHYSHLAHFIAYITFNAITKCNHRITNTVKMNKPKSCTLVLLLIKQVSLLKVG